MTAGAQRRLSCRLSITKGKLRRQLVNKCLFLRIIWWKGRRRLKRWIAGVCWLSDASANIIRILDQMTLNHRVPGSSPGAPTKLFKHLVERRPHRKRTVLQFILQLCSRFELQHRRLGELYVAAEIMRVENGFDVSQV